ncbi:MAG TPA: hypothetical protein VGQ93_15060 [Lysobacter sp.]|jgi:hypothetical protein|nr:hypothetical protein [Lysobacter sp.]
MRALWLVAALLVAPMAQADEQCHLAVGRGWPPATENYGTAVEKLFAGENTAALSYTLLPKTGAESGLLLIPNTNPGDDWTLRYAEADERVHVWGPTKLELRTEQTPNFNEVPIPADVATRLVHDWHRALAVAAPESSTAPFSEDDVWLFVVGDPGSRPRQALRVSGLKPTCELGEQLRQQIDLLIEASDEGAEKRQKRWRQLGESLDRMRTTVDAMSAAAAQ